MDYSEMNKSTLGNLAKEMGVYPEEGTGSRGKVIKRDLLKALKAGAGAVKDVVEEALTSQQAYQFDTMYRFVKPWSNYEVGEEICNISRTIGLHLVESGIIELVPGRPRASNPKAPFKKIGATA